MNSTIKYEVTYLTATGMYSLPSKTLKEAKADVKRLQELNKQPGNLAAGITINKIGK